MFFFYEYTVSDCKNCCYCCLVTKLCLIICDPMDYGPSRFLCPWGFVGKNTGVGCHFLLHLKVSYLEFEVCFTIDTLL